MATVRVKIDCLMSFNMMLATAVGQEDKMQEDKIRHRPHPLLSDPGRSCDCAPLDMG